MSTDNCKWVVYDGTSRVRCPTRKEALAYINERHQQRTGSTIPANIIDARIALNRAIEMLDAAANKTFGIEKLHLQRMAVKLKPVLVEIDNIVIQ